MQRTHPLPPGGPEAEVDLSALSRQPATRWTAGHWRGLMLVTFLLGLAWINLSRVTVDLSALEATIEAPQTGFLAPDFTLTSTDGETFTLSELRGTPVVLNFWATWCPPCRAEMPAFETVWQELGRDQVWILGINQGEPREPVVQFARNTVRTSFPLLLDPTTEVGRLYGVRALPTTVFIDAEGRIQDIKIGGPLSVASILDGIRAAER